MRTFVSVIIPTFNRSHYVCKAIDSVLFQSHKMLEVIVVDDGSTDDTKDRVLSSYNHDERVKYLFQDNKGVAAARNRGIRECKGDYIALLDSDDAWKPWKLELQLLCMQYAPECGMVWTDMEAIDSNGRVVNPCYLKVMYANWRRFDTSQLFERRYPLETIAPHLGESVRGAGLYIGDIFSPMMMGNLVHTSTVLLRRDRLERVKDFDERLRYSGEDFDFHLRTCKEGPVAYIDHSTIEYQIGMEDRLTHPRYLVHMTDNYLQTLGKIIGDESDCRRLSSEVLHEALASAHAWSGEVHLSLGNVRRARKHLFMSLAYRVNNFRVVMLTVMTCMPETVANGLLALYRQLKSFGKEAVQAVSLWQLPW